MKNTITISRQMGSQGCEVGQRLAEITGYRLIWRDIINQAAIQVGAPEIALATIDELGLLGLCPSPEVCQAYRDTVAQILYEYAKIGEVVIIGRAGQAILAGLENVIHIRVIAPLDVRIERVAGRYRISKKCAGAQIEASDRFRQRYLKKFYQIRWDDPNLYDLVINTAQITPSMAAEMVTAGINPQYFPFAEYDFTSSG